MVPPRGPSTFISAGARVAQREVSEGGDCASLRSLAPALAQQELNHVHRSRDGWEASFPWLASSPVTRPSILLPASCPFALSALLSHLLTFRVTGWKGLQDQLRGPQGNGSLSGPVAEQGLGRAMQAQMGVLRTTLSPHILPSTALRQPLPQEPALRHYVQ